MAQDCNWLRGPDATYTERLLDCDIVLDCREYAGKGGIWLQELAFLLGFLSHASYTAAVER